MTADARCSLKLDHLVGTDALRPYMHGYIMDLPVYQKARAAARPFEYAEHRQRLIAERLDKERESRIRSKGGKAALPSASRTLASGDRVTVNKTLADRLASGKEPRKRKRAAGEDAVVEGAANLLEDDRFGSLFTNPDFAIDERSREFAMVNPSAADRQRRRPVEEEDEEEAGQAGGEVDGQAGEDGQDGSESDSGDGASLIAFGSPADAGARPGPFPQQQTSAKARRAADPK
jgi:ribosome biogenesis protein ENP2